MTSSSLTNLFEVRLTNKWKISLITQIPRIKCALIGIQAHGNCTMASYMYATICIGRFFGPDLKTAAVTPPSHPHTGSAPPPPTPPPLVIIWETSCRYNYQSANEVTLVSSLGHSTASTLRSMWEQNYAKLYMLSIRARFSSCTAVSSHLPLAHWLDVRTVGTKLITHGCVYRIPYIL